MIWPSSLPIPAQQSIDLVEITDIAGHNDQPAAACVAGNQQVVAADRQALPFRHPEALPMPPRRLHIAVFVTVFTAIGVSPHPAVAQDATIPFPPAVPPRPVHSSVACPTLVYHDAQGNRVAPPHVDYRLDQKACYLPKYTGCVWEFVHGYRKIPPPNWCPPHSLKCPNIRNPPRVRRCGA